ncbi:MAG: hypothetical protein ABI588_08685, partial [Arenimonas sp.]
MKVQMQGQCVRLRVDEEELQALLEGREVENATCFGAGAPFRLGLSLTMIPAAAIRASTSGWQVLLPEPAVRALVCKLPCKEGLALSVPIDQNIDLSLHFDVDVRDSARARGK